MVRVARHDQGADDRESEHPYPRKWRAELVFDAQRQAVRLRDDEAREGDARSRQDDAAPRDKARTPHNHPFASAILAASERLRAPSF